MKSLILKLLPLLISCGSLAQGNLAELDPSIEASHIRQDKIKDAAELDTFEIEKIELTLDDEIENFSKFKGVKKEFRSKRRESNVYRSRKVIKEGSLLFKDGKYYIAPKPILAIVSHDPTQYFSQIVNIYDEEVYYIRNSDLVSTKRFFELHEKPKNKISYPKKVFSKKYYDRLPMLFKFDVQTELFKEGYLEELSQQGNSESVTQSLAAGLGIALHVVTNYDFLINFGVSSFFHTGTYLSGFEKTLYQSLFLGPEVILKFGSVEGINVYGICELTRSLYNNISDIEKTIDIFLRNTSLKFSVELKSQEKKSTWYTGAYYRVIESSMGRETADEVSKPRFRKNSNAFGLYFGRTFDFRW